jgi:hypothetical protein
VYIVEEFWVGGVECDEEGRDLSDNIEFRCVVDDDVCEERDDRGVDVVDDDGVEEAGMYVNPGVGIPAIMW